MTSVQHVSAEGEPQVLPSGIRIMNRSPGDAYANFLNAGAVLIAEATMTDNIEVLALSQLAESQIKSVEAATVDGAGDDDKVDALRRMRGLHALLESHNLNRDVPLLHAAGVLLELSMQQLEGGRGTST